MRQRLVVAWILRWSAVVVVLGDFDTTTTASMPFLRFFVLGDFLQGMLFRLALKNKRTLVV